jgi:hypothetical protein
LLKQEPDNSEDVICHSIIDYYLQRPPTIKHICLAEFVSHYKKNGTQISKRKKPNVIRFVKYNKHIDYENFCREKLLLYVPFDQSEDTLKHNLPTWEAAYTLYETTIQTNEARFTYNVNPTWGDLESALEELENPVNIDDTYQPSIKQLQLTVKPMICKQIFLVLEILPLKNVSISGLK